MCVGVNLAFLPHLSYTCLLRKEAVFIDTYICRITYIIIHARFAHKVWVIGIHIIGISVKLDTLFS